MKHKSNKEHPNDKTYFNWLLNKLITKLAITNSGIMVRKDLIEMISDYASLFALQIKSRTVMGYTDINTHAEHTSIPILNAVFDIDLSSANKVKTNHPAIDLIDKKRGIAFQITATATQDKVIQTLDTFINNNLYQQYPTLYIYILTEKKTNYNNIKIGDIVKGKFDFDVNLHIIDYLDILKRINYIISVDTLQHIAGFYKQQSTFSIQQFTNSIKDQNTSGDPEKKYLTFADHIKDELKDIVGSVNINKVPTLPELFDSVASLSKQILVKEKELEKCRSALSNYLDDETLLEVLTRAYNDTKEKYDELKERLDVEKTTIQSLTQHIRHQKEILDQLDQQQATERMKEAIALFKAGEYTLVNALLDYKGREEYIRKKLEEKHHQSVELSSLASEEVYVAVSMLQKQDWNEHIDLIKKHFEQSIELGGYGYNAYVYSNFLEDIDQQEQAITVLNKARVSITLEDTENRGLVLARLGKLLRASNKDKEALQAYKEALDVYELLFKNDADSYRYEFANVLYQCGSLTLHSSLDQARAYLEQAMYLLATSGKPASSHVLRLNFYIAVYLGYLHLQLDDIEQTVAYYKFALSIGIHLAIEDPDKDLYYLIEAINRFRELVNEEKEGPSTESLYKQAIELFLTPQKEYRQAVAYSNAKALNQLGSRLFIAQEIIGSDVCFQNALDIFKELNGNGYPCLSDIADTLSLTGSIYMIRGNMKMYKKLLLEALTIRKQLSETDPIEYLSQVADLLETLYTSSMLPVTAAQFNKANSYFKDAIAVYKRLDRDYQQFDINGWMQLLQNKSVFLSRGLDKSDVIAFYQELMYFKSRIPAQQQESYEENIQIAIHDIGDLLLEKVSTDHPLYQQINNDVIELRALFEENPEKGSVYLFSPALRAGGELYNEENCIEECDTLNIALETVEVLAEEDPETYEKCKVVSYLQLARLHLQMEKYGPAATFFINVCLYLEPRLAEQPESLPLLVSSLFYCAEALYLDGQEEKVLEYMFKAMTYLPFVNNPEQTQFRKYFEGLISRYAFINPDEKTVD